MPAEIRQYGHETATLPSCYAPEETGSFVRTKPPLRTAEPGVVVAGRYILDRKLGEGGMGCVWLAYDQSLQSFCALKVLHENRAFDDAIRTRFRREATLAARIHSENVVSILEHGEWQGLPYIAMEYIEGEDLDSRLSRTGKLDIHATYELILQLAHGLHQAHARGIVHRDIKPANVLLTSDNGGEVAKLVDFGVAKQASLSRKGGLTHVGAFLGTPDYASPEQLLGRDVDARSDLWSLGALTFECLTGSMPFDGETVAEVCEKILHEPIPSLCAKDPSLPATLDAWWYRAMARDPNQRYQSAEEFANGFAEAIGCAPVSVSSLPPRMLEPSPHRDTAVTSPRRSLRYALRWPALALLCLLLVTIVVFQAPWPGIGGVLIGNLAAVPSDATRPQESAATVVLTPRTTDSLRRGVSADAGNSARSAVELPAGTQLKCDIVDTEARSPRRGAASMFDRQR